MTAEQPAPRCGQQQLVGVRRVQGRGRETGFGRLPFVAVITLQVATHSLDLARVHWMPLKKYSRAFYANGLKLHTTHSATLIILAVTRKHQAGAHEDTQTASPQRVTVSPDTPLPTHAHIHELDSLTLCCAMNTRHAQYKYDAVLQPGRLWIDHPTPGLHTHRPLNEGRQAGKP